MSIRGSAARYARALFDVAVSEGGLDEIERCLTELASLVDGHAELQVTLRNPAVATSVKRGVIEALVERLGPPAPLSKLLGMLADRDRLNLLSAVAAAYRERLMDHQGVVQAEIVTAEPLDDATAETLRQRLSTATGRTVTVTRRLEPALLGGVVAKVGGTVYDGSVATQLVRMKDRLAASM